MLLDGIKGVSLDRLRKLARNEGNIPKAKGFWFWRRCPLCGAKIECQSAANVSLSDINDAHYEKCSSRDCGWERVSFTEVYPEGELSAWWGIVILIGIIELFTVPWLLGCSDGKGGMFIAGLSILGAWGFSFVLAIADTIITGTLRRGK